jgi:hypothetical protein
LPIWVCWLTAFLFYLGWSLILLRIFPASFERLHAHTRRVLVWVLPKVRPIYFSVIELRRTHLYSTQGIPIPVTSSKNSVVRVPAPSSRPL